jgi:glutathione synthase/RimK-type ligase-like ATP-grasp enzyme
MKILFANSKKDWIPLIAKGFELSQHEIFFADLSSSDINSFDLIVPLTIQDLSYLNKVLGLLANNAIPLPTIASIMLCNNKYLLNQALAIKGFSEFIPQIGFTHQYPYVLKKRIDEWGQNSHLIFNKQQEQLFLVNLIHPDYFVQAFIAGADEFATHILFKNKKIVHSITIKHSHEMDAYIRGRDKTISSKVCECAYLELFSSMLIAIGFEGLCCIDYKVVDNHPFILEINPRRLSENKILERLSPDAFQKNFKLS